MRRAMVLALAVGFLGVGMSRPADGLFLKKAVDKIGSAFKSAGKKVTSFFDKAGKAITNWGKTATSALKSAASKATAWAKKQASKVAILRKNIMPQFRDAGVRFRMPVEKPREFDSGIVWHLDTLLGKLGKALCRNYKGSFGPLSCYGDHRGTDYRLKGGFKAMDNKKVGWVVAGASGKVTFAEHHHFDRCTALDIKAFFSGKTGVTCKGQKFDGSKNRPNQVIIEHNSSVRSRYFHLKTNSIPWLSKYTAAKKARKSFTLKCGERIGLAGSSGLSSFPHLHFQVERKNKRGEWIPVDPYKGKYSQGYSYWVSQGSRGFPSTRCQK